MMIIAASQIITIINKSHHEINSIIRFLLPAVGFLGRKLTYQRLLT